MPDSPLPDEIPLGSGGTAAPSGSLREAPPARSTDGALPGVFALIGEAVATYRAHVRPLTAVVLCIVVLDAAIQSAAFAVSLNPQRIAAITILALSHVWASIAVLFAAMLALGLVFSVLTLALAYALRVTPSTGIGSVFRSALSRIWSYLWLTLASGGLYGSYVFVFAALPGVMLFAGIGAASGFATPTIRMLALPVSCTYAAIAFVVVSLIVIPRLLASFWIMLDGEARGVRALMLAARRIKLQRAAPTGRFFGVFGCLVFAFLLAVLVPSIVLNLALPTNIASFVNGVWSAVVFYGFILPLFFGALLAIHERIQKTVPAASFVPDRGEYAGTLGLGILGLLACIAFPVGSSVILASLSAVHTKSYDAIRETSLSSIQLELELYADANGAYPATLDVLTVPDSTGPSLSASTIADPVTFVPYAYSTDGTTYTLCAALSTGKQDCVTPDRPLPQNAAPPLSGNLPYVDQRGGYQISPPVGWVRQDATDQGTEVSDVSFTNPNRDEDGMFQNHPVYFVASLAVRVTLPTALSDQTNLDGFVKDEITQLETSLPEFKLETSTTTMKDGHPAELVVGTGNIDTGAEGRFMILNIAKDGRIYELSAVAAIDTWDTYGPLFQSMFDSFSFLPDAAPVAPHISPGGY